MVHPSRHTGIAMGLILGLSLMCATANAQVFSTPRNISNNTSSSVTPQVAVDTAGNIDVAWMDNTPGSWGILFSRSTDGGATFSTPRNISRSSGMSLDPRIAVDTLGAINVVWVDNTPGPRTVFFSRSADGGATFSTPLNLSNGPAVSNPQIAVDGNGNISVVWENDDITPGTFYTQSVNGGISFSTLVNLATNANGSFAPQLCIDGNGDIFVVWEDDFNNQSDISFSRSMNKGATFSSAKNLSNNPGNSFSAQVAVDAKGNIDVSWIDTTPGHAEVFFSRSTDQGVTFSAVKNASNGAGSSSKPQISADATGNIYLVWQADVPPNPHRHIFFTCSTDGGATFSSSLDLSNDSGDSTFPWLTVDVAGDVNVGWVDTAPAPGYTQTFFTQSTDHGATFSATQNLSNDAGFAADVQMAPDTKGNLNVVWDDDASGASQIFFSRLPNAKATNQRPLANAGIDQVVNCTGHGCALIMLDGSKSSDPDGDSLSFAWQDESGNQVGAAAVVQLTAPLGAHTYTLTVTDAGGLSSSAVTHVTVQDKTAPTLQVSLSPSVLRSRDDKLVKVTATINASDTCDPNPTVKLVSITSNDPPDRRRHSRSDVQAVDGGPVPFGTDVRSFLLRAEYREGGKDLVYTVTYSAADASGNTTTTTALVRVTRDGWRRSSNRSRDDDDRHGDKDGHSNH